MSSSWTSDLASLDGSLTLPCQSLEELRASQTVDVAAVLKQLTLATEAVQRLRSAVTEVLPNASWQTREELDALLAHAVQMVPARSRLLALAQELEGGDIVHRRAYRVEQLKQLRALAITELRIHAESGGEPRALPGPEVEKWIDWACSLKEPEDSASLEALHKGFAHLDDFVTALEPGTWVHKIRTEIPSSNGVELRNLIGEVREQLRFRLLALATELTRGRIVHHRAVRINQLNQLREQAIKELRSHANTDGEPPALPGPEAAQWIEWACGLKEPEDVEALQALRSGFASLDDFIANLKPDMWIGGGTHPADAKPEHEKPPANGSRQKLQPEAARFEGAASATPPVAVPPPMAEPSETMTLKPRGSTAKRPASSSPPSPQQQTAPGQSAVTASPIAEEAVLDEPDISLIENTEERISNLIKQARQKIEHAVVLEDPNIEGTSPGFLTVVWTGVQKFPWTKWRVPLAVAAGLLVLAVVTGIWRSHRVHSTAVAPIASTTPVAPAASLDNKPPEQPEASIDSKTIAGGSTPQNATLPKPQDANDASKQVAANQAADKLSKDSEGSAAAPVIVVPNEVTGKSNGTSAANRGVQDAPPPSLQTGVPSSVASIVTNVPAAAPKLATQQPVEISWGSAQQLVVSQVAPRYPAAARYMHIQGTVVVQAVIGKDGKIVSLRATSGHPLLVQASLEALKQWKFRPYLLNGVPVEADTQVKLNFGVQGN